ncbi:MAG: isoprenylcysteine carboxylmethyltransferase family protein [Anaerolineae bacterium]|nr:isoprenylcysteine carboxylmethyltransferase family protein [Anaerolineae bacterium]
MTQRTAQHETPTPKINIYGVNAIGKHIGQAVFTAALLFVGAGSLDWSWGWVLAIVYTACWIGLSIALAIGNPELLNQRGQRVKQATVGTKKWDLVLVSIYVVLVLVQPFVAGLDWRNAWSAPVSPLVYVIGNLLMILGFVPLTWSMIANRYFEQSVRIQESRGHQVATGGPYRFVRHPGYTGVILQFLALPIAVGMWAALIPGAIGIVVFVIRTALEDRTLQEELPGYAEYAQQTRYRLIPGIW